MNELFIVRVSIPTYNRNNYKQIIYDEGLEYNANTIIKDNPLAKKKKNVFMEFF